MFVGSARAVIATLMAATALALTKQRPRSAPKSVHPCHFG
jgi:hypothetical protein